MFKALNFAAIILYRGQLVKFLQELVITDSGIKELLYFGLNRTLHSLEEIQIWLPYLVNLQEVQVYQHTLSVSIVVICSRELLFR